MAFVAARGRSGPLGVAKGRYGPRGTAMGRYGPLGVQNGAPRRGRAPAEPGRPDVVPLWLGRRPGPLGAIRSR